jgi:erythromycin esterase-like protein
MHDIAAIREAAHPLIGAAADYEPLLDLVGDARVVLLGESTHGTHEFYHERARITRELIGRKGFTAVAVEADWPDAYRVNRYVRGREGDERAEDALGDFRRFPAWMWRNTDVVDLVEWLRGHNRSVGSGRQVGFYGLDLYSLFSSIDAVLSYLESADPPAAARARQRYSCFDHFDEDSQAYGYASATGRVEGCEEEAIEQLTEMQRRSGEALTRDGALDEDELFFAEQNARLVKNAEEYYRTMFHGRISSWNLRDRHMVDTIEALFGHLGRGGADARIIVWAHNSHIGDARATEMSRLGEWNVGQLSRERFGGDARLVGFTTHSGTVTAATDWEEPAERRWVRPAMVGSHEALLHEAGLPAFLLRLDDDSVREALAKPRLERAIGVIYRPETERASHYFQASIADQFDALIHIDETSALQPLEFTTAWEAGESPDTFPFGF